MTSQEWLEIATDNAPQLRKLLEEYHPISQGMITRADLPYMPITAPAAEQVCREIREQIKSTHPTLNPVEAFNAALAEGNVPVIITLLNQAWFGVPESTDCWKIPGFSAAVGLMDDTPDDLIEDDLPSHPTSPDKE